MSQFEVRFLALGHKAVQQEVMQADDEPQLRAALSARGLVALSVRPQRRLSVKRHGAARRTDYPTFCRELRTLIRAGMTVVEAVETLCARDGHRQGEEGLAAALRAKLHRGQSLSAALADLPGVPAVLVAAVRAGERTSNLADALDDYLRFDTLVQQLRRKVVSAAIYPALVTTLGIGIALFLLLAVLPNFARMYQNLRGEASGLNALVMLLAEGSAAHRQETLAACAAIALWLAWWVRSGRARSTLQRTALRIPWCRARVLDFQLAMLYQALALLLKGGYPLVEALRIAQTSALSPALRDAITGAGTQIAAGRPVSASLAAHDLCNEVDRRLFGAAERNGDFHLAADVVSHMHGEQFELFVERATRIVEPVLLLAVALLVGTIVVLMYLPVFDMATRLR